MPDIAMCMNSNCPSRMKCYRYMAEPNPYRQSYGDFKPFITHKDRCEYFTPIRKDDRITAKE